MDLGFVVVEDFLNELGLHNVRRDGVEWFFSCPFPGHSHGDSNPSSSMQEGTTLVHCFSCGFSGNAITFLSELEGISPLKSRRFIRERFGDGFREPETTFWNEVEASLGSGETPIKNIRRNIILDEEEADRRHSNWLFSSNGESFESHKYFTGRGFSAETIDKFKIGYDIISDRIAIPIRDPHGNLIGFKGRSSREEMLPRYKILGGVEYGFEPYEANRALFNSDKVHDNLPVIVCEGELNALKIHQYGFQNAVGISGKILSSWQASLITSMTSYVTLIFDEDYDALKAAEKLESINVRIVGARKKDPADMDADEVEWALQNAKSPLELAINAIM